MPTVSDQPASKPVESAAAANAGRSDGRARSMQVLMADDSVSMRVMLQAQLSDWGLEVVVAEDGAQAWELFQKHEMPLVLTDWMMPNVDGIELIRRIRASTVDHYVYVILLTSRSDKEDLVEAMDAGADDFLVKPCDNQELRVRLREGTRILKLEQTLAEKNLEIRNAQAALIQSEKMAGLGQLAAGMAHEINNPIAYVKNNLSVLKRDVDSLFEILDCYDRCRARLRDVDPDAVAEIEQLERDIDVAWVRDNTPKMFDASVNGLQRVRDIVRNLRGFARLDESEYAEVSIGDSIRSTLTLVKHLLDEKQISVNLDDAGNPTLHCRPAKINQVLHSILMNSIQACQSGDHIDIRVSADPRHLQVELADSGSGIDPEVLPHIFEPFFTTHDVGDGTGLGLSLCYGVVHDHGGEINVVSQLGQGTKVTIHLPRNSPTPGRAESPDSGPTG